MVFQLSGTESSEVKGQQQQKVVYTHTSHVGTFSFLMLVYREWSSTCGVLHLFFAFALAVQHEILLDLTAQRSFDRGRCIEMKWKSFAIATANDNWHRSGRLQPIKLDESKNSLQQNTWETMILGRRRRRTDNSCSAFRSYDDDTFSRAIIFDGSRSHYSVCCVTALPQINWNYSLCALRATIHSIFIRWEFLSPAAV